MANEYDRRIMPGFLQDTFAISLGCAFRSVEMLKQPGKTLETMMTEAKDLVTPPADAGEGLTAKAQALAAVWIEKGAALMNQCKAAGEKFTEGK